MPITAKIKMIIHSTKVKFPRAPIVLPMMEMSKFNVGQDLASLNTRNCKRKPSHVTTSVSKQPTGKIKIQFMVHLK